MNINFVIILRMLWALCVTVAPKLKQQTFLAINRQKLLNDLPKMDPSLRNLKDKLVLDIILYDSDKYKETVNKEIFFIRLVLSKIPSALKDHYLTTNLLLFLSLLYFFLGNLIWNTAYSLSHPSILIIHQFNILGSKYKVLLGSKHLSVQHFTKSVLTEVSVGWRIV